MTKCGIIVTVCSVIIGIIDTVLPFYMLTWSFLLLSFFLGTTMTKFRTILNVGTVISGIIHTVWLLCWLTLKSIAYLRHRRSRGAQYATDSSSLGKTFNGGFNVKPLWSSEGGAYDKLPTTDQEKKYHHVELPPTNKPYENQHGTPTELIFRGDRNNDNKHVDDDGSDKSTPLYPAGDQNIFTAVASGNDPHGIPPFQPPYSTIPPGFMGEGAILLEDPPHFNGQIALHIPAANNGPMPFHPSMTFTRPFPRKPRGPTTTDNFTVSDSSGEFLPVPDPSSSPTFHPILSASEKTRLKRIRKDFEYGPGQVMTGRFVRDNRGFGFHPDYTNGVPGVDANGVRLPPVPGKRLTTRQQHERTREQFRKASGDTRPLRPLPPMGYTWVANKNPTAGGPCMAAADESEDWSTDEET
ncbi:MAG: hypothetical protein LQ345_003980 [Seirophora villosa]|nr:MAG: hypothetical protein LQ345_003980 [Seirophora villosa]